MERPGKHLADELRKVDLFMALDPGQLQVVIDSTRVVRPDSGQRLFDHGLPARQFFRLRSGQLELFRSSPSGGEKIIEIVRPEEMFAQAVMFMDPGLGYPVSCETIEPNVPRESVDSRECERVEAGYQCRCRAAS